MMILLMFVMVGVAWWIQGLRAKVQALQAEVDTLVNMMDLIEAALGATLK